MRHFKAGAVALAAWAWLSISGASMAAEVDMWDGQWHFGITPYGWFPAIGGKLNFEIPPGTTFAPTAEVKPSDYLHDLQFGLMVMGEARKGDVGIFTDIVYADIAGLKSQVKTFHGPDGNVPLSASVDANLSIKELLWTLGAGYTVARGTSGKLDVFLGVRYGGIRQSFDADVSGSNGFLARYVGATTTSDLWDAIIGVRGSLRLSEDGKWFMPYQFDGGGGNSNTTWDTILGVGYRFDWGDVLLAYRYLAYEQPSGKSVENLHMDGPALGVRFTW